MRKSLMPESIVEQPGLELRILVTAPTSLGRVTRYLVLVNWLEVCNPEDDGWDEEEYDEEEPGEPFTESWLVAHEHQLAEQLNEEWLGYPVYVLHALSDAGDRTYERLPGPCEEPFFSRTITMYDSGMECHCLAYRQRGDTLMLRSGFHDWSAMGEAIYDGPTSWETMELCNLEGTPRRTSVSADWFWRAYDAMWQEWEARF
jgi:hypothetical protein